jgi:hypothetical protein
MRALSATPEGAKQAFDFRPGANPGDPNFKK